MNITLTDQDVKQFADSGRLALRKFLEQYALLRPKFPTITDAAVNAMMGDVQADPQGTQKRQGIDAAVYFAALFAIGAANLKVAIRSLDQRDNAAHALHSILQQTIACANVINALTLLGEGGLMPQLHVEEAQSTARKKVATGAAAARHAKTNEAKAWVQQQWLAESDQYEGKADFARIHVGLVANKFGVNLKVDTIANWLTQ